MRNTLLATTMLVGASGFAHAQSCQAPGPAAAAGYNTQTLGPAVNLGSNWSNYTYLGNDASGDSGLSSASVTGPCPAVTASTTSAVIPAVSATPIATPVATASDASAVTAASPDQDPTPGDGTATDCSGNTWAISASGAALESGEEVPGGHGTSDLIIRGCTVYGEDAHGGGWYTMSSVDASDGQYWNHSAAPDGASTAGNSSTPAAVSGDVTEPSAAPLPIKAVTSCPATASGGSGGFHVAGGQIIGPNGQPFVARGINVYSSADPSSEVAAAVGMFPGLNFVRFIARTLDDPSSYQGIISQITSLGIVIEIEDHPDGGGGQDSSPPVGIVAESAWYQTMSKTYGGNPYVWYGTYNEPAATSGLSEWQYETYKAVRSGSNAILMVEVSGSRPANLQQALNPGTYSGMTNIVWDAHFYGYIDNYDSTPATLTDSINGMVSAAQTITSADGIVPVIIGESGPSTTGSDLDPNGYAVVEQLINVAQSGKMGGLAQFTLYPGFASPNDITDGSGNPTAPYGQMVKLYTGPSTVAPSQCQIQANADTAVNAANAKVNGVTTPVDALTAGTAAQ